MQFIFHNWTNRSYYMDLPLWKKNGKKRKRAAQISLTMADNHTDKSISKHHKEVCRILMRDWTNCQLFVQKFNVRKKPWKYMHGWNTICIIYLHVLFARTQKWRNFFFMSPFKKRQSYITQKKLVIQVKENIFQILPNQFDLPFDRKSTKCISYVTIFCVRLCIPCWGYCCVFLNFSPFENTQ